MMDKKIIMGIMIGLCLGITPVAFSSYYSSSKSVSDLKASELRSVIQDALSNCKVSKKRKAYSTGETDFVIDC